MNDWKFHFWLNHVSFYFERELYGEQRDILCDFARDIYTSIAEIEKLFARDHVTDLWQQ